MSLTYSISVAGAEKGKLIANHPSGPQGVDGGRAVAEAAFFRPPNSLVSKARAFHTWDEFFSLVQLLLSSPIAL
jgi:hypothetical protein